MKIEVKQIPSTAYYGVFRKSLIFPVITLVEWEPDWAKAVEKWVAEVRSWKKR